MECGICRKTETKIVLEKIIEAEGSGKFFYKIRKKCSNSSKSLNNKVASNPTQSLDFAADKSTATAIRNCKEKTPTANSVFEN